MQTVVGVFGSRVAAEQAMRGWLARGVPSQSVIFLSGEAAALKQRTFPLPMPSATAWAKL